VTLLFRVCAVLLILGALIGWAVGHLLAGVLFAVAAIAAIIIFLGDDP
jgi:hypothetical protein